MTNFLTSGHIQADRAISNYIQGKTTYYFPDHEIFKGMMLGQWKHYREGRAECANLYDSRLGTCRLLLLRLFIVALLYDHARNANKVETPIRESVDVLGKIGASESQVLTCLRALIKYRVVRTITAERVEAAATVVLTRCGGYYLQHLCRTFEYAEATLLDTAIDDADKWCYLSGLTEQIEKCGDIVARMSLRVQRIAAFMKYLLALEDDALEKLPPDSPLRILRRIEKDVMTDARNAEQKAMKYYGKKE